MDKPRPRPVTPERFDGTGFGPSVDHIEYLLDIGRTDEAIALLADSLATEPTSAPLLRLLSRAELERRGHDAAVDTARSSLASEPDSFNSLLLLAQSLASHPSWEYASEAMEVIDAALHQDPNWAPAYRIRAQIWANWAIAPRGTTPYRGRQCYRAALADIDHAIELRSGDAESHAVKGRLLLKMGRRADAKSAFGRALEIDPHAADPQTHLARLAFDEDRIKVASQHAVSGVETRPDSPHLHQQVDKVASRRLAWPVWFAALPTVVSPSVLNTGQATPGTFVAPLPLAAAVIPPMFAWWWWKRIPRAERSVLVHGGVLWGAARYHFRLAAGLWLALMALGIAHAFVAPFPSYSQSAAGPPPGLVESLWNVGVMVFGVIPIWWVFQKGFGLAERIIQMVRRTRS